MCVTVLSQQINSKFSNLTLSYPSTDLSGHYLCAAEKQHVMTYLSLLTLVTGGKFI